MKNIKIIVYLAVMTLFIFSACKKEDNFTKYDLGTEFLISGGLTSLDNQVTVNVTNLSKNLSTISVSIEGSTDKLTDIPFCSMRFKWLSRVISISEAFGNA